MYSGNAYPIRRSHAADKDTLRRLAEVDSQRPFEGPALIGYINGRPAAAVSLADGRVIADPFENTVHLSHILRMRFEAFRAYSRAPSLPQRMRDQVRTIPASHTHRRYRHGLLGS